MEYVLDLLAGVPEVSSRKKMGEYLLYSSGKLFGGVYDDRFLVKDTGGKGRAVGRGGPVRGSVYDDAGNVGVLSADAWGTGNKLRRWLNRDFLKSSFSKAERARLVRNDENDFVTCLTVEEAERYFTFDAERRIPYVYESDMAYLKKLKDELGNL